MKKYKIQCNRIIAKAKKDYWVKFCEKEILESKDVYKVWKKVKDMKNKHSTQSYPVNIDNNKFPSPLEKAEAFAKAFCEQSSSSSLDENIRTRRAESENKEEYKDPEIDENLYINCPLTINELNETLASFATNTSAVGIDGISYQMLCHA